MKKIWRHPRAPTAGAPDSDNQHNAVVGETFSSRQGCYSDDSVAAARASNDKRRRRSHTRNRDSKLTRATAHDTESAHDTRHARSETPHTQHHNDTHRTHDLQEYCSTCLVQRYTHSPTFRGRRCPVQRRGRRRGARASQRLPRHESPGRTSGGGGGATARGCRTPSIRQSSARPRSSRGGAGQGGGAAEAGDARSGPQDGQPRAPSDSRSQVFSTCRSRAASHASRFDTSGSVRWRASKNEPLFGS